MALSGIGKAIAIIATLLAESEAAQAETFVIEVWPNDLAKIPCEFWKRSDDGRSWRQVNSIIVFGKLQFKSNNFKGHNETEIVDEVCGSI